MIIEFDKLIIKDFGAYADATLDFNELGLGVHFVMGENKMQPRLGSNGAGKTTLWNALCWCLFGKTLDGLRNPDVIPWGTKAKPEVTVIVYIGKTEDQLRGYKIKRSTISNGMWINGKVVQQETIDALLGLNYTTLPHTILLGQKQPLFFDLSRVDKMDILTQVLNLGKWDERSAKARMKHKTALDMIAVMMTEKTAQEKSLEADRDMLDDLKAKSRAWEGERADRARDREAKIEKHERALEEAQEEFGKADLDYDGAETELRACKVAVNKAAEQVRIAAKEAVTLQAQFNSLENEEVAAKAAAEAARTGQQCPTCKQPISKALSKAHQAHHDELAAKATKARKAKLIELHKAERTLEAADKRLSQAHQHEADWLAKSNQAVDYRERAQTKVLDAKAQLAAYKAIGSADTPEANPYSELIERCRASIKKTKQYLSEADQIIAAAERKAERIKYWVEGFKTLRLYLLRETLAELQAVTNMLLPSIGLDDWLVSYDVERETKQGKTMLGLSVTINSPSNDKAVKWESFSGGEGQRLRLIGAIALSEVLLRRAGVQCDLLVLDEPTKHMSPQGISETVEFLIERGKNQQVFYCDHAAVESNRFASVVKVVKTKQGATIKV